jgi:hypothetical protein
MQETLPMEPSNTPQPRRSFVVLALLAATAALVAVAFFYFARNSEQKDATAVSAVHLWFGPAERSYAPNIRIENIALSRAENFIHQEVTTLTADAVNGGGRTLAGLEVTIEFFDDANQIALRETHAVLGVGAPALASGGHRSFEVSFEHIPSSWNRQQPIVQVTGMQLVP